MEKRITDSSVGLTRKNRRKQIWYKVVSAMACVVVFCTTYALILPAITLTEDYYCGFQEHIHTEECYRRGPEKTSICTAQPHVHQGGCYDADGGLICGMADFFLHTHSEICYDGNGLLVCQMEERQLHTHSEGCYLGEWVYSCGKTEGEAHVHGDGCFRMEQSLICGQPEQEAHHHDESCYCQENVLVCALQEQEGHQHTDGCYGTDVMLVCEQEGLEDHIHTEECYQTTPKLLCEMEECEAHFHGEGCYASQTVEVCGLEETEGHTHEESCYGETAVLCCEIPEGEVHYHDEACQLLSEPVLVCDQWELILEGQTSEPGKLSVTEHIHTESCFQTEDAQEPELICGMEEHTHRLACTSDRSANRETAEIWRTTLPEKLTGDPAADLLAVAESQFGYQESARNFEVTENDKRKGYTRYGQWYGDPYGDWCAMYVSFCLHYAGIPEEVVPYHSNCPNWLRSMEELGLYRASTEHIPVPGDIVFFGESKEIVPHVGIVKEVTEEQIITIEGNTSNRVDSNNYLRTAEDSPILGYGSIDAIRQRGITLGLMAPPEEQEPVQPEETVPVQVQPEETEPVQVQLEEPAKTIELEADYGEIHIRLIAPCDAFPVTAENLSLMVTQPSEAIWEELSQRMGEGKEYLAVDIEILCDGVPIQPNGDVQVIFEPKNTLFPNADGVDIYHAVEGEENEILDMRQVEGGYNEDGNIFMEADHFSTYVVTAAESEPTIVPMAETPTNTWQEALTDRSNNIGVKSEGYADSPYDFEKEQPNLTNIWTTAGNYKKGGTFFLKKKCNQAEKYWDGSKPFRITSASDEQAELWFSMYSDLVLEDNDQGAPYGALKLDNVSLLTSFDNPDIHARGNKLVIGENVSTNPTKRWRIFGGATQYDANDEETHSNTNYITNVIVNSGTWAYVYGGGLRDTNHGTQVTIRNEAVVGTVYGGGRVEGDINNIDNLDYVVNIYIEGGVVGEVFGGSETERTGLKVNGNIKIDVSGGQVGTIYAGNDHRKVEGTGELEGSKVRGGAVVNVYNTGSVTNVVGDYTHYDAAYGDQLITFQGASGQYTTKGRHIRDLVELNIHSNNEFGYMDYWDIIRINNQDANAAPNSVNVTSLQGVVKIGDTVVNNVGSEYIGRMEVTNGGRFYVKDNCFINYMNEVNTTSEEGVQSFSLDHAWMGEPTQDRQAWSTLAVEGSCIEPSTAATDIFTLDNPCDGGYAGLRIKGNVEGFSTLEACGEPMYSTGDTYYYYVVADSSDNGGKAFREPEGAPYVVCYRYLDDGRIGWYLRERPVLTMDNSLVRVGTEGTLTPTDDGFYGGWPENYVIMHVDMKGFAYEWSNTPGKNRVEFNWSIFDGYENATEITGGISLQTMADIENNIYSTSNPNGIFANVEYNARGTDEGSTVETERVSSFYVIIDTSRAVNPRYYEVGTSFHYTRGEDDYDDLRVGQTANAARCTYDFANTRELLGHDGYANSVMTTYEYEDGIPPKGDDDALLRVYLPEGVSADMLTVKELDEQFTFENTGKAAALVSSSQVAQYYSTEEESTYNHRFGVTLQQEGGSEIELAGGAALNNLSGKEAYHCAVYSHEKISFTDITPESDLGLQLGLQLNSLTKNGEAVGRNDPSAVNNGELRIQVYPVGTIIETTRINVQKIITGENPSTNAQFDFLLSYPKIDENGQKVIHEERFTLRHNEIRTIVVPLETTITVQEINHDGYWVQVQSTMTSGFEEGTDSGSAIYNDTVVLQTPEDVLPDEAQYVTFYNTPGAEMPSTGGLSATNYTFLGLLLMMGALLLWMHRRERGTAY